MAWLFKLFRSSSQPSSLWMEEDWRNIKWDETEQMKSDLKKTNLLNPEVPHLRILIHGPVGAGKSSLINSIDTIFQGQISNAAVVEAATDRSFTTTFNIHNFKDGKTREKLPFVMCDIMGLETGDFDGVHSDDLIKILNGQIKNGHKFNPMSPCSDKDPNFISNPTLGDRVHCLLSVIPADKIGMMGEEYFTKMRHIRKQASEMTIPQLVMLTKVDEVCPEVKKDIRKIYKNKKIKEKMLQCSSSLGVSMSHIFPVKNYHEEIDLNDNVNALLLSALKHILHQANNYVENQIPTTPANMKK